jgi:hypothetical protein
VDLLAYSPHLALLRSDPKINSAPGIKTSFNWFLLYWPGKFISGERGETSGLGTVFAVVGAVHDQVGLDRSGRNGQPRKGSAESARCPLQPPRRSRRPRHPLTGPYQALCKILGMDANDLVGFIH